MVDFKKRLAHGASPRPTDPQQIYDSLDRQSDKGPLRPAQHAVLQEWFTRRRTERDVIVKLHTGQGKTLIGLLILQSQLNANNGPSLYLCPNNLLVDQTCRQAEEFGVPFVKATADLPSEFLDGQSILITSVHKLFNGLTRFGLGSSSVKLGSVVIDDCHACIEAIRGAFTISLDRNYEPYRKLLGLFATDLQRQGEGTFLDIEQGSEDALLPVPYWSWNDHVSDVLTILSAHADDDAVKFAWRLLKDRLSECQCIVGSARLDIAPYLPPLHEFRSFTGATHRVFMSATITDDSFLVKGLGLEKEAILSPLRYPDESWFGEKLILLPSLVNPDLQREQVIERYANLPRRGNFGVVVLTPSFRRAEEWAAHGATVATRETVDTVAAQLRNGDRSKTVVFANRYDGIDLPDAQCRILVLDSLPLGQTLVERHHAKCRVDSDELSARTARAIEQGLGRSVRGEKDFCVFLLTGGDLVKFIRTARTRAFFSDQTLRQIEIGLEVAQMAAHDSKSDETPHQPLTDLVNQCLKRDDGWKDFYTTEMNRLSPRQPTPKMLDLFAAERDAEHIAQKGQPGQAVKVLQQIVDGGAMSDSERGWYIQEMARYWYGEDKAESRRLQQHAYQRNPYLLKPQSSGVIKKLSPICQSRGEAVIAWVRSHGTSADAAVALDDILSRLHFGVEADRFEAALDELARAIGLSSCRPEKELKEGPDNLWQVGDSRYALFECKNEVELRRKFISKSEAGQVSTSAAWFERNYMSSELVCVMITPATELGQGAFISFDLFLMGVAELKRLCTNVRLFFESLKRFDPRDLIVDRVYDSLVANGLGRDDLPYKYVTQPKQ